MMRAPWFWESKSLTARLTIAALTPAAMLYGAARWLHLRTAKTAAAPLPVICIGNATAGGAGKTPFAMLVHEMLRKMDIEAHFLTRGYGGREAGPLKVDLSVHKSGDVGDEALLLARHGAVWIAHNRPAGAIAAHTDKAPAVIMDDGYQNPSLSKTFSILLLDSAALDDGARLLPAGPLREPISEAIARADLVVAVGADKNFAAPALVAASGKPHMRAWLAPRNAPAPQKVVAFCGIGKPDKFFDLLRMLDFDIAQKIAFPDHHIFTTAELAELTSIAARTGAALITTEKDHVRLPAKMQADSLTLPVAMKVSDPDALKTMLKSALDGWREAR